MRSRVRQVLMRRPVIFCYCLQVLGKGSEKQGEAGVDEKYLLYFVIVYRC